MISKEELTSFPALSVYISRVTNGCETTDVTTTPGYSNRLAVTSIWHSLAQDMDAGGVEDEIGAEFCTRVVGSTRVVMIDRVTKTVDTVVNAGNVVVKSDVGPGR